MESSQNKLAIEWSAAGHFPLYQILFSAGIFGGSIASGQNRQYDVARDGRFLINTMGDGAASPITLIQNCPPDPRI